MPEFTDTILGKRQSLSLAARRPTIGLLGESHGTTYLAAAIAHACYKFYPADVTMDYRTFANGGQMFAVGASTTVSTSPRGLALQVTDFQTRPADIAFIAAGWNDQPSTNAAAITVANNVLTAAANCIASGAQAVVIMGLTPRNYTNGDKLFMTMNNIWRNACFNSPNLYFVDVTSAIADRAATGLIYKGGTAGTLGSFTQDGTHWGSRAIRAIAPLIADVMRQFCPARVPRLSHNAGNYDPVSYPYANMLGDGGNMMGTSGVLKGSLNIGVAGSSTASRLNITVSGGVDVTAAEIVTGPGGERKQRLTLGGTITGSNSLQVLLTPTITAANGGDAARMMTSELIVDLAGVTGLTDVYLRPTSATYDTPKMADNNNLGFVWEDATERLFIYSLFPIPVPAGNNPAFTLLMTFRSDAGFTPAGQIELSRWGSFVTATS